jgi:hypothetical protein
MNKAVIILVRTDVITFFGHFNALDTSGSKSGCFFCQAVFEQNFLYATSDGYSTLTRGTDLVSNVHLKILTLFKLCKLGEILPHSFGRIYR